MNRKTLNIIIALLVIIFLTPILIFVLNFHSQAISGNISDWGTFGDYVGGTLNTFISLISLIILSYLTYLIGAQSNAENKNTNLLLRKMDAYNDLTQFLYEIENASFRMNKLLDIIRKKRELNRNHDEERREFEKEVIKYTNFSFFLSFFEVRYGHLFNYNFDTENYRKMLSDLNAIKDYFESLHNVFDNEHDKARMYDPKLILNFLSSFTKFVETLKSELK